jgi:hypothetical protein
VRVAVLVLGEASPADLARLRDSLEALARRLADAHAAYRPGAPDPSFTVELVGPLQVEPPPPLAPPGPGPFDRALHAWRLWRAVRAAHAAAPGFLPDAWDVRVYLQAEPAGDEELHFAEGLGEQGGEVGVVDAGLHGWGTLLAATAVFHEVFHCLGASDKYDAAGHAVLPGGLAEPGLEPRFPQRLAELMVGEVPLGPASGRLPTTAAEVGVGPVTAAEVGWRQSAERPAGRP